MIAKTAASTKPALPDIAAMEAFAAAHTKHDREQALSKAQDLIYDAWERKTVRAQKAMALKAIAACPLCADAFNLLADHTADIEAAAELYRKAVKAGELALGPEGFRDYEEEFWGFLETRPYMRARRGLALSLLELGDRDAAIDRFRAILELNPDDNQGIRYLLLAQLLRRNDTKGIKALLSSYPKEWSVQWLYTRALAAFREGRKTSKATLKLLKEALECNQHVPAILAGSVPPYDRRAGGLPQEIRKKRRVMRRSSARVGGKAGTRSSGSPRRRKNHVSPLHNAGPPFNRTTWQDMPLLSR